MNRPKSRTSRKLRDAGVAGAIGLTMALLYPGSGVLDRYTPAPTRPQAQEPQEADTAAPLAIADFQPWSTTCYDRSAQPETAIVDSHLHFRPFGGAAIPFDEVTGYLEATGVIFANVYGIGQMLPANSPCTYYLDCPGTPLKPTLRNDFVNAANVVAKTPVGLHLTLSMTFPDLSDPDSVLDGMAVLDDEYPALFLWMGEVNLVKQAIFANGGGPVPAETIPEWAKFMRVLREREIPLAIHADLGNEDDPTLYLPLMEQVLDAYPDNRIVWMHMGLSRELTTMDPGRHAGLMTYMLNRYPNLMLDITWRVIDDAYFSTPEDRAVYVPFLNAHSDRILPGTDFLASADKNLDVYQEELDVTSRILSQLDDDAFRDIALGGNYFRLLDLRYKAPAICEIK